MFQRDNAPVEKVRSIKTWFAKIDLEELDYDTRSPDQQRYISKSSKSRFSASVVMVLKYDVQQADVYVPYTYYYTN